MSYPQSRAQAPFDPAEDNPVPDPAQAQLIARMRRMMIISGATTVLAILIIVGVIGYRVFNGVGSAPPDMTTLLPKGAKIIGTAVTGDRVAVIVDISGSVELRTFDLRTLQPAGRLKFATEP
jgi:hypothetical protein